MKQAQQRTIHVEISLSPAEQIVLSRYIGEVNAIIARDNEVLRDMGQTLRVDLWEEDDAINALIGSALDRERKVQRLKDGHQTGDPGWVSQLVREIQTDY